MKRYSLGESYLVNLFISEFNSKYNPNFSIENVSGITLSRFNEFKSVVEYFEFDKNDIVDINTMLSMCKGSILLSEKLNLPLFIIYYVQESNFFYVYNFAKKNIFKKSFVSEKETILSDFILWWLEIKGTIQTKIFYKAVEFSKWKINQVLESNLLKWGGDIDGLLLNKKGSILAILEFRKSTYKKVSEYDPAKFYLGTANRRGDFLTWLPLVKLSKALKNKLILITLSNVDNDKCGFSIIIDNDRNQLYYDSNGSPDKNVFNSFEDTYLKIIKTVDDQST